MTYTINGFKIETAKTVATTNLKFFSQRQLHELNTNEAKAELARRDGIAA